MFLYDIFSKFVVLIDDFLSLLIDLTKMIDVRMIINMISKSPTVIPLSLKFIVDFIFSLIYPFLFENK